jgi:glycosyltransferase involved in cell wall biosynthesis
LTGNGPINILQVVGRMNRGGAETWLMHVLRHIDRERFHVHFLAHSAGEGAYDSEIRALGSRVLHGPNPHQPVAYARHFTGILRGQDPYHVVHSHVNHFSGYHAWLAHRSGVPVRIAHSHEDSRRLQTNARLLRRAYLRVSKRWIRQHATVGLAPSEKAALSLFGPQWADDPRRRVFYCGIDLSPFRDCIDKAMIRHELGIPGDAIVLGHVGSFSEPKNHSFLVQIAAEVNRRVPDMRLLLVGDGPLRPAIERQVVDLGLEGKVIFAGPRSDVPELMRGAMDVFVMPSHHEGLPLAGIETQAAGLPAVISDVITTELDVVPDLIRRAALSQPASAWAETILAARALPTTPQRDALRAIEQTPFNIERSVTELEKIYANEG